LANQTTHLWLITYKRSAKRPVLQAVFLGFASLRGLGPSAGMGFASLAG